MDSQILLWVMVAILCFEYLFEEILDRLNLKHALKPANEKIKEFYSEEELEKARKYLKTNSRFSFITGFFFFLLTISLITSGFFGLWDDILHTYFSEEWMVFLVFIGTLSLASSILRLPLSYYQTFVIEEKFGFNTSDKKTFWTDKIKGFLLSILIGAPILLLIFYLSQVFNQTFWLPLWGVLVVIMLFFQFFYTSLILPLFNKLTPLQDEDFGSQIKYLSERAAFPFSKVLIMDGSKRSKKANAFFSGFGSQKKIVLFDTLMDQMEPKEVLAVLAHEIGHYKRKHIWQGMGFSIFQTGLVLFILSWFVFSDMPSLALGADEARLHLNLIAFGLLFSPISQLMGLVGNLISRRNEYQADDFAFDLGLGKELGDGLKKLTSKNLSNPNPHPAYVFWHYSHPTTIQRLDNLQKK